MAGKGDLSYGIREKKPGSENVLERHRLMWENVVFEPGTLEVRALDAERNAFKGYAVGIFRTLPGQKGEMRISVSAEGLPTAKIRAEVN